MPECLQTDLFVVSLADYLRVFQSAMRARKANVVQGQSADEAQGHGEAQGSLRLLRSLEGFKQDL